MGGVEGGGGGARRCTFCAEKPDFKDCICSISMICVSMFLHTRIITPRRRTCEHACRTRARWPCSPRCAAPETEVKRRAL